MFSSFVGRAANESKGKSPPAEAAAVSHRSARLTALQVSESIPKYLQLHPVHLYLRMCSRDVSANYALQCNALTCHSAEHTRTHSQSLPYSNICIICPSYFEELVLSGPLENTTTLAKEHGDQIMKR